MLRARGGASTTRSPEGTSSRRQRQMPTSPPMLVRTRLQTCPPATRRREAGGKLDGFFGSRMSSIAGVTRNSIVELVVIVAVALGLALGIQAFIIKPYRIPSGSMEPTLAIGQRVLVNRIGMDFGEPHVGEIAVFHPPEGAEQEECGPTPHVIKLGASACSEPVPKQDSGVNFIKRDRKSV